LDFGCKKVLIGGAWRMLHFLVASLGYSRRRVVFHLPNQRQASWFIGIEAVFRHLGGIPLELLVDNASPLVLSHNVETGHVEFHPEFLDFCSAWGVAPKACRPYRARTKGKVENAVKYVKRNALAGRSFACETEVAPYLLVWSHRIDGLVHGTTHEVPMVRFDREERVALLPLPSRAPWNRKRREKRVVGFDGFVMVDTVRYAVPMEHVGRPATIEIDEEITVFIDEKEVICHPVCLERHRTIQHEGHWSGMATRPRTVIPEESTDVAKPETEDPLCRPLAEYEAHVSLRVAS
jgi:hypothetical protein